MKQNRIFFDIETLANVEACALMNDPKPPANLKDPVKIAAAIEEKRLELIESAALDPDYGKVLSIGVATTADGPITVRVVGDLITPASEEKDVNGIPIVPEHRLTEHELISGFWAALSKCTGACVGYNILGFDLPYLMRRSMALGIKVPFIPNLAKFRTDPVTDLMAILYNWDTYKSKGLKQVAKLYHLPIDCPDIDGSMVKTLNPDELRAYQASDVKLVMALYQKMNGVYFNHF
jgi:DNA polymerase elongation subunit (family B)